VKNTEQADLRQWFAGYVKSFYTADAEIQPKIVQKEEHSLIVAGLCRDLAVSLGLDAADVLLAEAVGLCHDVGRFKQATLYRTFRDHESVDHGRLGVEEMVAAGFADRLSAPDWKTLAFAVRWHNAVALPLAAGERLTLFGRIIRDSDKLDIYRVLPPDPPAAGCSPGLEAAILAGRSIDYQKVKTADDRKLVMLGWLYDIHYVWTLREIVGRGYVSRLLASLPPSPARPEICRIINGFTAAKLGCRP